MTTCHRPGRLAAASIALVAPLALVACDRQFPADAGIIDVTDPFFGAVPDDGIDDTAAIQRVFDLMTPSSKIVYFPDGVYDISDQIVLEKKGFVAEAEDLPYTGWVEKTEGDRTFLEAVERGSGPDDAGRITFDFDAIEANRAMRLSFRVSDDFSNSFYYRVNGGEWRRNTRRFNGNDGWRNNVVTTDIPLETDTNRLEIAVRETGFQLDRIEIFYLGNYLNDTVIQGQSEGGTVLQLADDLANPDGTPFDRAILAWENGVEQFFRTAVRDLTFDVGTGNPAADGLRFHGNNQSTVANVTFRAAEGSGDVGLDLAHTAAIGPILVRDVTVEGFAVGIHSAWQNASRTFEDITLSGQREYGWVNEAASTIFVRGLTSRNAVQALRNTSWRLPGDGQGRVVLLDSTLEGLPGAEDDNAIVNLGIMYARNVTTSGYRRALVNNNQQPFRGYRGQDGIDGDTIGEWWSNGAFGGRGGGFTQLFESPDTMLGLPVAVTPWVPFHDVAYWDGPHNHRIELEPGVYSGIPNDGIDDTASIQAAIDSGAFTVYLPNGFWTVDGEVRLRGNVQRLLGTEARIGTSDRSAPGRIVVGPQGASPVVVERWGGLGGRGPVIEHASKRTLVLNDITGLQYEPTVESPGDVFINDTVGGAIRFAGGQRVWARQLNIEETARGVDGEPGAKIVNDGADLWVLGFKTENEGVHVKTINGGRTELLGNLQNNRFGSATPQYVTEEAALSVATNIKWARESGSTYGEVVETRGGETRTGRIRGSGYAGFDHDTLWDLRQEVIVDNDDAGARFAGDWAAVSSFPRGFIGADFAYALPGAANVATYAVDLPEAGQYEVFVRWIGDWGGQPHSGHARNARYEVIHADGTEPFVVDQDGYSDGWYSLGTFDFAAGVQEAVRLTGEGADGKVNTDGVRLVRRASLQDTRAEQ